MSTTNPIRVLIVDDHAMVRSGLKNFIYAFDWMEPIGEAANGAEAVAFCAQNDVDVILMDMIMPGIDGSEATRQIKALGKQAHVIILTSFHEQDLVEQGLQAGATGYLLKNVTAEELAAAIRSAAAGKPTLSPEATESLIAATLQRPAAESELTERELEVLALLASGATNVEIAEQLTLSMATVKFHLTNIFAKLGVRNRVEAARFALEHNLANRHH